MDGYTIQVIALCVLAVLVIGWVLDPLVGHVLAALRGARQERQQADARPRWGADDVPTLARSRPRPPSR